MPAKSANVGTPSIRGIVRLIFSAAMEKVVKDVQKMALMLIRKSFDDFILGSMSKTPGRMVFNSLATTSLGFNLLQVS